jgi:hypothetical protein
MITMRLLLSATLSLAALSCQAADAARPYTQTAYQ